MYVILIYNNDHELLGVSHDYPSAIKFLISDGYLRPERWYSILGDLTRLSDFFGVYWESYLKYHLSVENFNNMFKDHFILKLTNVY